MWVWVLDGGGVCVCLGVGLVFYVGVGVFNYFLCVFRGGGVGVCLLACVLCRLMYVRVLMCA